MSFQAGTILYDSNAIAVAVKTSAPVGTENALVVRNIPSGTQPVSGTVAATQSGTWNIGTITTVTSITNTVTVAGNKTNNNAAPGATNIGVLGAIANAMAPTWTEGNQVGLSVDLAGALRVGSHAVTDGGGSLTVDGTVAATQSGTWNIGTVTTLTSITNTVTVAGGKTNNNAAPGATNVGVLGAIANAAAPTWVEGNLVALSVDLAGALRVGTITSITNTVTVAGAKTHNSAVPGATNVGALVALANAAAPTFTETYETLLSVDLSGRLRSMAQVYDSAGNAIASATTAPGASDRGLVVRLPGTAATVGTSVPASGDSGLSVRATAGGSMYHLVSAATTNATSVKASAGSLLGYMLTNNHASAIRYVKFYNKASAPTVGTDTPVLIIGIPAGGSANISFATPIPFSTGIAFATTTGMANADTGAVALSEVSVGLIYA